MSRTDLDAITLANMLRRKAGDGSIEWVMEPIQTSVLLDIADALDENAKLRELAKDACTVLRNHYNKEWFDGTVFADRMRELGIEVGE